MLKETDTAIIPFGGYLEGGQLFDATGRMAALEVDGKMVRTADEGWIPLASLSRLETAYCLRHGIITYQVHIKHVEEDGEEEAISFSGFERGTIPVGDLILAARSWAGRWLLTPDPDVLVGLSETYAVPQTSRWHFLDAHPRYKRRRGFPSRAEAEAWGKARDVLWMEAEEHLVRHSLHYISLSM